MYSTCMSQLNRICIRSSNSIVKTPAVSLKELMATEEKKSRPVAVESMATSPNEKFVCREKEQYTTFVNTFFL